MQLAVRAVLLALFMQAANASAVENRIEFVTSFGEKRVEQSEVCFFPADSNETFFGKFLSTNDVRCLSADAVISLPLGLFNVFARHGSMLIDSHPTLIDNLNPGEPGYRAVALPLHPAATLDVRAVRAGLRDGEWFAVYLTNESRPESLASVHPVPDADTKILVPADMPFVPMIVRRGAIVRVGKPIRLRAGETMSLPKVDQWGSGRDVVALLRTDALLAPDVPPQLPVVDLHCGTAEPLRPMFPLRDAGRFDESLAIFKDVPSGTHPIRLSGEGWQRDEITVTTTSTAEVVIPARPLHARLAGTVEVRASIGELATIPSGVRCPADVPKPPSDEDELEAEVPEWARRSLPTLLQLLRCDGGGAQRKCTAVREAPFPLRQRDMRTTWPDLEPGVYVAELSYRWFSERSRDIEVRLGRAENVTIALQVETVTGRVRHGNSPVRALISFGHSLLPALSDESGNYTAVVGKGPNRNTVKVRICSGGGYQYLPKSPVDKILDIDIPKNELVVRVVDEQGRPLPKAAVYGGPMFPEEDAVYAFMPFAPADADGETRFADVVKDAALEVCAGYTEEYEQGCAPHFKMGERKLHRVEIVLQRRATMSGKLLSPKPFVAGTIWLVSANGAVVDRASLSPTGEFTLKRTGIPGEYLVSASHGHPLAVFELPGPDRPLEFEMPTQSQRVTVVLSPNAPRRRQVALELSGRMIPMMALSRYLPNGVTFQLQPGDTSEFRDIGPGALVVYSVPWLSDYPPDWKTLDALEHPHLRITLPRYPVTGPVVEIE